MNSAFTDAATSGLDRLLGFEGVELDGARASAQVPVREELLRALGSVQGGVYAAIAENLTRTVTARAVAPEGRIAIPLSSQLSFLRPIGEGAIHASAQAMHRGRTTWVWEVELSDDQGRLCALARVTLAIDEASAE